MIRKLSGICFFFFLTFISAVAQKYITDSVFTINGVEVATERFAHNITGVKIIEADSLSMQSSFSDNIDRLLIRNTSVYIKENGITGLSSVSFRGTGTSHTAILWNGFNIQNPMNGGMDLSLIPVGFMDKIALQYNGMSALYGGGALGGAIHLSNVPDYDKGLSVTAGGSLGSFYNYSANVGAAVSLKKTSFELKAFYLNAKNDFPFINNAKFGSPREKQTNSGIEGYGLLNDNTVRFNDRNSLSLRLWMQHCRREIPPLMTQVVSNAEQQDEFYRPALEWVNSGKKYKLFVRTAVLVDDYEYRDPDKLVNSASGTTAAVTESEIYFKLHPYHTMNVGIHYKYTSGFCDYYDHRHSQQEISAFVSYSAAGKNDKWKLNVGLREEYSNNDFVPLLPSLAMDVRLYKDLFLYFNFSRNYRIPTLNDLFWQPGGNPNLKPESGFAEEIGIRQKAGWEKIMFEYTVSGFNNNTQNWIIWLPMSLHWSPQNIQAVWSRGAEADLKLHAKFKAFSLDFSGSATFVKSTVQKGNNQSAIGCQLVYTPEWLVNCGIDVIYKTFCFNFNTGYYSKSYTASDNTESLDPYMIGNLFASKNFNIKNFSFNVFLQINNIWNQTYQSIAWQAMPGINFKTGIQLNFKHSLNKRS